ncbi:MAG TPA: FtsQ-type POTRA domain-containing protein, partial [Rugosimonospora sp.]|nr:FtsQ-type POTRA domain-containing protein [Rugosimonospora sp.]
VPASVRRFNQRVRQRRIRAVAPWLAALIAVVLAALVGWVVYGTSLLGVRTVRVSGNSMVTADQVRDAAAVPPGAALASLDLRAVAARVQRLAPVRVAKVTRDWPSTVVIAVSERVPVAVLARPDRQYDLVDATGVVFATLPARPAVPLLQLTAPGPGDPSTQAALQVLAALTPVLRDQLVTLVATAPTRIRLELAGSREIVWGDASQNATKARVATSLLSHPGRVIDVSAPDVVTVR